MTDDPPKPMDEPPRSFESTTGDDSTSSTSPGASSSESTEQPLDSTGPTGGRLSPSGATAPPGGAGSAGAGLDTPPTTATSAECEPPREPPPAPPGLGEGSPPPAHPPDRGRRERPEGRRGGPGLSILGLVLVLLGLGLLLERVVPGVDLGTLWPYGAIVLGLALVVASVRVERGPGR